MSLQETKEFIKKSLKEIHDRFHVMAALGSSADMEELFGLCDNISHDITDKGWLAAAKAGNIEVMEYIESCQGASNDVRYLALQECSGKVAKYIREYL